MWCAARIPSSASSREGLVVTVGWIYPCPSMPWYNMIRLVMMDYFSDACWMIPIIHYPSLSRSWILHYIWTYGVSRTFKMHSSFDASTYSLFFLNLSFLLGFVWNHSSCWVDGSWCLLYLVVTYIYISPNPVVSAMKKCLYFTATLVEGLMISIPWRKIRPKQTATHRNRDRNGKRFFSKGEIGGW